MEIKFQTRCGSIRTTIDRVPGDLCASFRKLPTSILSDCLDRFNVVDPSLSPVLPPRTFAGPAFTVEEIEGGNLMSHLALKYIQPGDVLVIDAKGLTRRACWGGLQTFAAKCKGVAAIIIDGAARDRDDILKYDIPVYCRSISPAGPHKGWGGRVNATISCGNVTIAPGDLIVGDSDGVIVIPREATTNTLARALDKQKQEELWFQRVADGADTADFLGFVETAASYGITVDDKPFQSVLPQHQSR